MIRIEVQYNELQTLSALLARDHPDIEITANWRNRNGFVARSRRSGIARQRLRIARGKASSSAGRTRIDDRATRRTGRRVVRFDQSDRARQFQSLDQDAATAACRLGRQSL